MGPVRFEFSFCSCWTPDETQTVRKDKNDLKHDWVHIYTNLNAPGTALQTDSIKVSLLSPSLTMSNQQGLDVKCSWPFPPTLWKDLNCSFKCLNVKLHLIHVSLDKTKTSTTEREPCAERRTSERSDKPVDFRKLHVKTLEWNKTDICHLTGKLASFRGEEKNKKKVHVKKETGSW